jgi:hypothetical protein
MSSVHTKVRPLLCAMLSIGNILEFLCRKWKLYPRDVFYKSRLVYLFDYCFIYEKFVACREFWLASE